ncbi:MAG: PIN domain-containing protein [Acetobacteraceae bacterium]|nr:PIN domain-containing protein [Pseudomonadota bacterium]
MVSALFATNILIDYLPRLPAARAERARYSERLTSSITWIEILVGAPQEGVLSTRAFLQHFDLVDLDEDVAEIAAELRRRHQLTLPDAIIWRWPRRTVSCLSRATEQKGHSGGQFGHSHSILTRPPCRRPPRRYHSPATKGETSHVAAKQPLS